MEEHYMIQVQSIVDSGNYLIEYFVKVTFQC